MDFFNIKKYILLYLKNLPGWTTPRKIVVFISDDWGDQRIKDEVSYQRLLQAGIPVDKSHHTKYGALFTFEDLFGLYEVLSSFKDINGRYAVFTPFMVMANPDFRKIENSLFEKYYYEVFADTLIKQTEGDKTLAAMMEGMRLHLFEPEFHGRDHLNVPLWLKHLKKVTKDLMWHLGIVMRFVEFQARTLVLRMLFILRQRRISCFLMTQLRME